MQYLQTGHFMRWLSIIEFLVASAVTKAQDMPSQIVVRICVGPTSSDVIDSDTVVATTHLRIDV